MLARRSIRALFPLTNGEVWVTTTSGVLLRGRGTRLDEVPLPASADGEPAGSISQVVSGENGDVFVLRGAEVWQIAGEKSARGAERTAALENLLQQDAAAEPGRGRTVLGESGVRLRGARGELWQFTSEAGMTVTDSTGRTEPVALQPDAPSGVRAMMEDREGNLWLATGTQGLWRLRPSRVEVLTTADGLSDRAATLVFEDRAGALWAAPQAGGLDCWSAGAVKHFPIGPAPGLRPVSALLQTRAGVIWAATPGARVYSWKGEGFSPAFPDLRGPGKVLAMVEDERGRIWFGGRQGLATWEGSELRLAIDFGAPEVVTALVSTGPTIWAGTESGKVFRGAAERFEAVGVADAFARQPISSLLPEADGSLWVGTMGGGLFHVREGRVVALAPRMSEVDVRITCVLDDGAGFLWMGTLGGICRAEKTKLLGPSSAPVGATLRLDRSDGLLTRECTRGGQPAGWRGHDGTLYFSTGHGIARVRPERLPLNTVPPPVLIEEAGAGADALALGTARLQAGPGRTRLDFRFTALTFTAPEKVRFRTRLEGLDETWRDAGGLRTAAYEAVPPGDYRFHVMAENGDGVWNETGASLAIEVLPHFWETRWFQAGVALLVSALAVAVGALIMRARMRGRLLRLEAKSAREAERARIAQDLHDDLGASLTEISLLANLAAEERRPAADEDDTLPEIAATALTLVSTLDEIVWAANPRQDTLRSLAEYLSSFAAKFLGRAGITLRREVPRDLPEVSLDAERRHSVFLAAREALNNAVKHSGASEVWLRLRLENRRLEIAIEDNGRGFDTNVPGEGDGVGNLASRLARLGGLCRIESRVGGGTSVFLSLPMS